MEDDWLVSKINYGAKEEKVKNLLKILTGIVLPSDIETKQDLVQSSSFFHLSSVPIKGNFFLMRVFLKVA